MVSTCANTAMFRACRQVKRGQPTRPEIPHAIARKVSADARHARPGRSPRPMPPLTRPRQERIATGHTSTAASRLTRMATGMAAGTSRSGMVARDWAGARSPSAPRPSRLRGRVRT